MEICNNCMCEMTDPLQSLGWTVVIAKNPRGTSDDVFYCPNCPPNPHACSDCYELRKRIYILLAEQRESLED